MFRDGHWYTLGSTCGSGENDTQNERFSVLERNFVLIAVKSYLYMVNVFL